MTHSVCVYCGSSPGTAPHFMDNVFAFGALLAKRGLTLVYGGGDAGLMGACARGALSEGGKVVGIIPDFLLQREQVGGGLDGSELVVVASMHERKTMMFERADAFVALPGGIGTLEELVEMMTWAQLGRHKKPMAVLDMDGFWQPLANLLSHMDEQGFIHSRDQALLHFSQDPEALIEQMVSALGSENG